MSLRDNFDSPVIPLPQNLQRHNDAGWKKIFTQKQLFPITIPTKSKYKNNVTYPRPFPKLSNLTSLSILQPDEKGLQRRNPSFTQNQTLLPRAAFAQTLIRARDKKRENNRTTSTRSKMKRSTTNSNSSLHSSQNKPTSLLLNTGRPISAPVPRTRPRCLSNPTPTPLLYRRGSSVERFKNLQISSVDLQQVPDDRHDKVCRTVLLRKSASSIVTPSDTAGSKCDPPHIPWWIQNHLIKLAVEDENLSVIRRQISDKIDSSSDESKSDLIAEGVKLLTAGREIIQNSTQDTQASGQTLEEVAVKLHEIVTGQLRALKEENEALKAANRMLKQQLISFTSVEDTAAATVIGSIRPRNTPNTTPSTSQKSIPTPELQKSSSTSISLEKPSLPIKDADENSVLHVQPPNIENPLIKAPQSCSKDIVTRVSALEETVTRLLSSNAEQTSKLQDRMYEQEIRYEETLSKFEEVIANMTTMFAGLQTSYNIHNQNTNSNAIPTSEFEEALDTIAKASSKRVQFKGILKTS